MKRYRVQYRQSDRQNDLSERAEEVYADGWRVDVPRSRVTRIQEIGG